MRVRPCRHRGVFLAGLAAAAGILWSCGGPPAPPREPNDRRVAASHRNIGIPYGPWVLLQGGDRVVALRVTSASPLGNRIDYEWAAGSAQSNRFSPTDRGRGSLEERASVERLSAGPLLLNWSRGSGEVGWLYWPDNDIGFAVCATTFEDLEDIRPDSRRYRWYTRERFKP